MRKNIKDYTGHIYANVVYEYEIITFFNYKCGSIIYNNSLISP